MRDETYYHVQVTSSAQDGEWEGDVLAASKQAAVLLAGYEMGRQNRWPTGSPWITVEKRQD